MGPPDAHGMGKEGPRSLRLTSWKGEGVLRGTEDERKYCTGQVRENTARGRRERILRGADERKYCAGQTREILRGTDERKYCAGQTREMLREADERNTARGRREKILRGTAERKYCAGQSPFRTSVHRFTFNGDIVHKIKHVKRFTHR